MQKQILMTEIIFSEGEMQAIASSVNTMIQVLSDERKRNVEDMIYSFNLLQEIQLLEKIKQKIGP